MSLREQVVQELETLGETQLEKVADYLAFLKFQERIQHQSPTNESEWAALYAEFAEEDRALSNC